MDNTFTLRSPEDTLAAVPYFIGFHPEDSIVVLGVGGEGRSRAMRADLPPAGGEGSAEIAAMMSGYLERDAAPIALIVGYGDDDRVAPAVRALREALGTAGIAVKDALRASEGRYWSYMCTDGSCCPPEGTAYDVPSSVIAAQATAAGLVALPDRAALEASVAPLEGPPRESIRRATARAAPLVRAQLADPVGFVTDGLVRLREALAAGHVTDDKAARLGYDLAVIRIRDEAWVHIVRTDPCLAFWHDLTRRIEEPFVPAVASLLGVAAWMEGCGTMAGLAFERALAARPGYSMADLLLQALSAGLDPDHMRDGLLSRSAGRSLDAAMGRPRGSWLRPVRALLDGLPRAA